MTKRLRFTCVTLLSAGLLALLAERTSRPARAITPAANCPVSLTNPDGQALALEKYDLRVAVHGPLSLVEMEMVFRNPEPRVIEGRFLYLLPPGATISRFAKEVDGKLMEGEVVERLAAQRIYTEILHTMRDPALLEMDQGNRFSARVFPVPAGGTVRLLLAYSQLLPIKDGARTLTIPMAGMPKIGEFKFSALFNMAPGEDSAANILMLRNKIDANNKWTDGFAKQDFTPEEDIQLKFTVSPNAPATRAIKAGNFQMLSYRSEIKPVAKDGQPGDLVFYFDTSASNADTESRRLEAIKRIANSGSVVSKTFTTTAYAFDLDVVDLKMSRPLGFASNDYVPPAESLVRALRARHSLGATNLEAALKHIGETARNTEKPARFVLVSDGIATLGAREARELVAALGEWPARHDLYALVLGNKQDEKILNAIVEKTRGRVVTFALGGAGVPDREDEIAKAIAELWAPLGDDFEFYDEGAAWIYPKEFRDVRLGSELIVFSELKEGTPSKPGVVRRPRSGPGIGKVEAVSEDLKAAPAEVPDFAPLLRRETYRAYLDQMEQAEQAEASEAKLAEMRKRRVEVSVKNRVLCPLTSLLVLETEEDYRRFGVQRTALADVMAIGEKGIELRKRKAEDAPVAGKAKALKEELKGATKNGAEFKDGEGKGEDKNGFGLDALTVVNGDLGEIRRLEADRSAGVRDFPGPEFQITVVGDPATAGGGGAGRGDHFAPPLGQAAPAPVLPPSPRAATRAVEPPAPPRPAIPDPRVEGRSRLAAPAPEAKPVRPEWAKLGVAIPEATLNELRAKVQAAPRDRTLRNAYADALFKTRQWDALQGEAFAWLPFDPENPQVYEYLGRSAAGLNDPQLALRAITSIAEIAPNRAALLARAGWLLLAVPKVGPVSLPAGTEAGATLKMAQQMFREALKNRQDDPNLYRGLALSLWLDQKHDEAAKVLEDALAREFHERYGDAKRVLREELNYVLRAWLNQGVPLTQETANKIYERLAASKAGNAPRDALRVTLAWETDANDVDLHVVDPSGEECFYSHPKNASGLELYSDQTQGLGPEVIRCGKALPGLYHVGVNYYSAGAMGVSRGVIVIIQPQEGKELRPLVVPFCLVPGGPEMRHLAAVKFE